VGTPPEGGAPGLCPATAAVGSIRDGHPLNNEVTIEASNAGSNWVNGALGGAPGTAEGLWDAPGKPGRRQ
jgi:hypothetical protein